MRICHFPRHSRLQIGAPPRSVTFVTTTNVGVICTGGLEVPRLCSSLLLGATLSLGCHFRDGLSRGVIGRKAPNNAFSPCRPRRTSGCPASSWGGNVFLVLARDVHPSCRCKLDATRGSPLRLSGIPVSCHAISDEFFRKGAVATGAVTSIAPFNVRERVESFLDCNRFLRGQHK